MDNSGDIGLNTFRHLYLLGIVRRFKIGCFFVLLLSGCGFNKSGLVDPRLLQPTGWKSNETLLDAPTFDEYSKGVYDEVFSSRIPFVPANATKEVRLASPSELQPLSSCGQAQGIVVLVHGLSDSAFSMRDLAQTLTANCYITRTALLPGHGTRPGDLLNTGLTDWKLTVQYLIDQASREHNNVITVGFSLGALLTLSEAIKPDSPIDAAITISPAFYLTTSPYAEMTRWLQYFKRWLDTEKPDDTYRYEAIPTKAVAETVAAKKRFHQLLTLAGTVNTPWLVIQSADDLVVESSSNQKLFVQHAKHQVSRLITYRSDLNKDNRIDSHATQSKTDDDTSLIELNGWSDEYKISGLTHVAIHQSPNNPHYGVGGDYRNCGIGGPRPRDAVRRCQQAESVWSGPWDGDAPDKGPYGLSTFNPDYDNMSRYILEFLDNALPQKPGLQFVSN